MAGWLSANRRDERVQPGEAEGQWRIHPQPPARRSAFGRQAALQIGDLVEDRAHPRVQFPTAVGEFHPARGALQQPGCRGPAPAAGCDG